jgi:hypothetical protein
MNTSVRRLMGIGICLLVTLTVSASEQPQVTLLEKGNAQITTFLQYFYHAKSLDAKKLHELYMQEEDALLNRKDNDSILRLALIALLPDAKLQTTSCVIDLLQSYLHENNPDEERRQFAAFLLHTLSQLQYRALNQHIIQEKLNTTLQERDELTASYQQTKGQLEHAWSEGRKQRMHNQKATQALLQERRTVENLRKQIEQLKGIEKKLDQRKKDISPST